MGYSWEIWTNQILHDTAHLHSDDAHSSGHVDVPAEIAARFGIRKIGSTRAT